MVAIGATLAVMNKACKSSQLMPKEIDTTLSVDFDVNLFEKLPQRSFGHD